MREPRRVVRFFPNPGSIAVALVLALVGSLPFLGLPEPAAGKGYASVVISPTVPHSPWRTILLDSARHGAEILRDSIGSGSIPPTVALASLDSSVLELVDNIGKRRDWVDRSELLWLDAEIASVEAMVPPLARLVEREKERALANLDEFEWKGAMRAVEVESDVEPDEAIDPDYHAHPGILRAQQAARDDRKSAVAKAVVVTPGSAGHRRDVALAFRAAAIPLWDEAIAIARRPYPAAAADWDLWNRKVRTFVVRGVPATTPAAFAAERARDMLESSFPDLSKVLVRYTESIARLHGARILLRLRARTIELGRWPSSLFELGAGVPEDPFTEGPFRYRLSDDGVLLYSPGPDGRDDGGDVLRDLVVCVPRTAH